MRLDQLWYGTSPVARLARAALWPASALYAGAMTARNLCFDLGLVRQVGGALPVVSVGNLSVGGTGKTPVVAYLARELLDRGVRPGIALRGYGGDEVEVHRILNPEVSVIVDPDRVRAARRAVREGRDVLLLDDGFQHRRIARTEDIVLVDAERGLPMRAHCLPSGPLRERATGLRRASLVAVTAKSAELERMESVRRDLATRTAAPIVGVRLVLADLRGVSDRAEIAGAPTALSALAGRSILVVSAVGNPLAFEAQLAMLGAKCTAARYPDHHAFTPADAGRIAAASSAYEMVICTLKDAVKLRALWPRTAPALWYVSQRVEFAWGREVVDQMLQRVMQAQPSL
jgi:tetraacyldisaccharide 4'-kinase